MTKAGKKTIVSNGTPVKRNRPPIVSVLGHVDHGKTTLLDRIRKSNVADREAGGITQGIGASQVEVSDENKITFIDTPGHAAFSKMRSRGAKVSDIAILVVAANDGVKPQTKEALKYIEESGAKLIVALTKIDLPTSNQEKTLSELSELGVSFEGRGGDVPMVEVSGKTGKGIDELLETISLLAQVNDIAGDENAELVAYVIETNKDRRGVLVTAVIRDGSLSVGDEITSDKISTKARGLFDFRQNPVKSVGPGDPVLILGFPELPEVGSQITKGQTGEDKVRTYAKRNEIDTKENLIPIVVKAKSKGGLDAVLQNIPEGIVVIHSGVGDVNDNDVFIAKSAEPPRIFVFEAKVPTQVSKLADTEGVKIYSYDIIYKIFEKLDELVKKEEIDVLGETEILSNFPFNNKLVAGCKVRKGRISKSDKIRLMRSDTILSEVKITSMRKHKDDIDVAKEGEELGIIFEPQLDFQTGDVLLSIR